MRLNKIALTIIAQYVPGAARVQESSLRIDSSRLTGETEAVRPVQLTRSIHMRSLLQATVKFARSRSRFKILDRMSREWRFMNSDLVTEKYLLEIFPEAGGMRVEMSVDINHHFELPYGERSVLAAIASIVKPKSVFEFGTYSGSTTMLLAQVCGANSDIHTLDLPDSRLVQAGIDPETIGHCINASDAKISRIVQHRVDSREFDFSSFQNKMDLIYIDGSHEYDDVLRDSESALRMLAPKGVIVWDDYHTPCIPVAEAIDVIGENLEIYRIRSTRMIVHRSK